MPPQLDAALCRMRNRVTRPHAVGMVLEMHRETRGRTVTAADLAGRLHATVTGDGWAAKCPAHEDTNASLSVSEGHDGRVLLHCFAGCEFPAIVAALGLKSGDLSPPKPEARKRGRIVATYDYTDANGKRLFQVVRLDPKDFLQRRPDPANPGAWLWNMKGQERVLYHLPAVLRAKEESRVVFVAEGEKDCDALVALGLVATCNPGGACKWQTGYTESLAGCRVVVVPDKDDAGRKHAAMVAAALHGRAASVRVLELPDRNGRKVKDPADWTAAGGDAAELDALVAACPEWTPPLVSVATDRPTNPVAAAKAGVPFPMTDLGNAERLVALHGDSIRWDTARRVWRVWDGKRWATDSALKIGTLAADTARHIQKEAAAAPAGNGDGADIRVDLFKHAVRTESRDRLAALVEVAKSLPGVAVAPDQLDADPMLLNVANGTIDLRTGTLRKHNRDDLLTKLSPVEYNPAATCERWRNFLVDSTGGDLALIDFLQIAAGYTLTGLTDEEKLMLVYGPEASGKTTFLESLRAVMGDYAATIDPAMLTKSKSGGNAGAATPEVARLAGVRYAAGSELEQGRELAEALAKSLTGGETITARHLYAELFDFRPQFKLWLAVNHCPRVSADDGAIWRRILRIGFDITVPPERRDKSLKPYLRNPEGGAVAVLAWAVAGCLRWQREGLVIPACVARSTAAFREESDPLAAFVEDCLNFDSRAWTLWSDIWKAYTDHADDNGTADRFRVAPRRLQERITGKGCQCERKHAGRGWSGVEVVANWTAGRPGVTPRDARDPFSKSSLKETVLPEVLEMPSRASRTVTAPDSEDIEERAALLEFDAGMPRERAEAQAVAMLKGGR